MILIKEQNHYIQIKYYIRPIGIRSGILIGLFLSKFFNYLILLKVTPYVLRNIEESKLRLKIALISLPVI